MSERLGQSLGPREVADVPKRFDLVSADGSIVGDAKYYTLVGGERVPPAKFSVIAEYVWMLEKTQSVQKSRRVPGIRPRAPRATAVAFSLWPSGGQR